MSARWATTACMSTAALLCSCTATRPLQPQESLAIREVHERWAQKASEAQARCLALEASAPPRVEAAFPYGEATLSDAAERQLLGLVSWLRCNKDATVMLQVEREPRHRQPFWEQELMDARVAAARGLLRAHGIAEARLWQGSSDGGADGPAAAHVRLYGRGW